MLTNLSQTTEGWPHKGARYFYLTGDGETRPKMWTGHYCDIDRKKQGNIFKTKEGAELKAKQNETLAAMRVIADSEGGYNIQERKEWYEVVYDSDQGLWRTGNMMAVTAAGSIVFPTDSLAMKALTPDLNCLLKIAR